MQGIWSHFFFFFYKETIKEIRTLCDVTRRIGKELRLFVAHEDHQKSP